MDVNSTRRVWGALDSFRREFKRPGQNHRHRKSDNEQQHHKTHGPIRNFEERKNLTRDLHQEPGHNAISNRNLVNVAPLQLREEGLRIHSARLDEALVTAALYLDACDLKSVRNVLNNRSADAPAFLTN